jgi:hypothetical protein
MQHYGLRHPSPSGTISVYRVALTQEPIYLRQAHHTDSKAEAEAVTHADDKGSRVAAHSPADIAAAFAASDRSPLACRSGFCSAKLWTFSNPIDAALILKRGLEGKMKTYRTWRRWIHQAAADLAISRRN